ncbi:MAG: hypothetical protein ACPGMR_00165 [Pontibacterium sp.]
MIVSTDKTLIAMIEKKDIFWDLIDYLDEQQEGREVPLSFYYERVRKAIQSVEQERDQKRLRQTLDIDNLAHSGLLMEVDRHRSVMVFQPFVIEMFRHFDRSRLRELSSEQLEALRSDLNNSLKRLQECRILQGDEEYEQVLVVLFERLRNAHARIKQNVLSLQGQADYLSKVVEEQDIADLEQTLNAKKALEEINQIYQKHVLPTLQFLNEREHIKTGYPALTAVEEIATILQKAGMPSVSQRVLYAKNSIRAYAKDIEVIRKTLERYVRQSARQRHQYDCIESAFNKMREQVFTLYDGKLNSKYLDSRLDIFEYGKVFAGLKKLRFDARLEWGDINHTQCFNEHLRVALPRLQNNQKSGVAELDSQDDNRYQQEQLLIRRKLDIQALMESCEIIEGESDVHHYIHNYLAERLSGYALPDLLEGLGWLRSRLDTPLKPQFSLSRIHYKGQCLEYFPLALGSVTYD